MTCAPHLGSIAKIGDAFGAACLNELDMRTPFIETVAVDAVRDW
ncbi:hypothetical protein [Streptomyces sp. NPDC056600]